jgi:hypothetical protein
MSRTPGRGDHRISLEELRATMTQISDNMQTFVESLDGRSGEDHLPNLAAAVGKVNVSFPSRPPHDAGYTEQWNAFASGNTKHLDPGAVRYLCWVPYIGTSDRFLAYVWGKALKLTARPLAGLVRSCHATWKTSAGVYPAAGVIKDLVKQYEGSSPVILKWKSNLNGLFGSRGPETLGRIFIGQGIKIGAFFDEWYLDPTSPFAREFVQKATDFCRDQFDRPTAAIVRTLFGELLPWGGWDTAVFKQEISALILRAAVGQTRDILQKFVMIHRGLGDPRLARTEANWAGIDPDARSRFETWLAENPFALMERVYREGQGWTWQKPGDAQTAQFGQQLTSSTPSG